MSEKGFVATYPMRIQEKFEMELHWFCKEVGVPVNLIVGAHQAQTYIKVNILCYQIGMILKISEKGTPWANISELYISLLKEAVRKYMYALHSPMVLWDYEIECCYLIHNNITRPLFQNNYLTPHELNLGAPADISNLCVYGCYKWTYYRDCGYLPENRDKLGILIGPIKTKVIKRLRQ